MPGDRPCQLKQHARAAHGPQHQAKLCLKLNPSGGHLILLQQLIPFAVAVQQQLAHFAYRARSAYRVGDRHRALLGPPVWRLPWQSTIPHAGTTPHPLSRCPHKPLPRESRRPLSQSVQTAESSRYDLGTPTSCPTWLARPAVAGDSRPLITPGLYVRTSLQPAQCNAILRIKAFGLNQA